MTVIIHFIIFQSTLLLNNILRTDRFVIHYSFDSFSKHIGNTQLFTFAHFFA